ncbi:hypothetical protein SHI21_09010 [Bacteriovorax sp. PP10]|uniref:Uncharacterized protein n=1 Tax=Bacteriovorax antarcticus TaxID=3088717 RepID=A0ABU5VXI7_9BACT|nr:hypothetical protein [Bacteriovorax sp. PP10]MEA9356340.1 hypothetical protein [Bacteriovorax sp. PP10]
MNKKQLLKSFQDLKKEIEILRKKHLVQGLVDKFHAEKRVLEKRIEKTVVDEVKKAKKFMTEQKKELNKIQKKVEAAISKRQGAKKKSAKKATKKVAKVVKSAKKATKKVSKK